jgi:hypothetical protein
MRKHSTRRGIAVMAASTGLMVVPQLSGVAHADALGPNAFEIAGTCTGLGQVLATNEGPAHAETWQVIGTNTVLHFPENHTVGPNGWLALAEAAGTTCTVTAAGPPGDLQPFDQPIVAPVYITNG